MRRTSTIVVKGKWNVFLILKSRVVNLIGGKKDNSLAEGLIVKLCPSQMSSYYTSVPFYMVLRHSVYFLTLNSNDMELVANYIDYVAVEII